MNLSAVTLNDPLVNSQPVKKFLGIKGDRTFYEYVHRCGIPHYAINKRVIRFRMSEVEQWLSERRKGESL